MEHYSQIYQLEEDMEMLALPGLILYIGGMGMFFRAHLLKKGILFAYPLETDAIFNHF